jgi:ubiquinone/menaquinone biosynthesis C-methylase UbiE
MGSTSENSEIYNDLAPVYDRMHGQFLRMAGNKAQLSLETAIITLVQPGDTVLDAGCGTGKLGAKLMEVEPSIQLTLLDPAPAMLARCKGIVARRLFGSLAALPFTDRKFDLTICSWALETSADEYRSLAELLRVTRHGGHIIIALCTDARPADPLSFVAKQTAKMLGTARFVDLEHLIARLSRNHGARTRTLMHEGVAAAMLIERS